MQMQNGDVLDRLSIVLLKLAHADAAGRETVLVELKALWHALAEIGHIPMQFTELIMVNAAIWELESDIRKGKELGLEEVGRRALQIRDLNRKRVEIRNQLSEFKDIKMEHASA